MTTAVYTRVETLDSLFRVCNLCVTHPVKSSRNAGLIQCSPFVRPELRSSSGLTFVGLSNEKACSFASGITNPSARTRACVSGSASLWLPKRPHVTIPI